MTIGQVEKHREVIKWFVDNPTKGVWRKDTSTNEWHIDNTPNWCEDYTYIQNDKYAKFRKALIDGKELQYTEDDGKTWSTHYRRLDTWFNTKNIRIKPKEWYEDPNMIGKPVWVKDYKSFKWQIELFKAYNKSDSSNPFITVGELQWKYAKPVKPEDLYQEENED